jgi:DNA-binding NtrC family response regulator
MTLRRIVAVSKEAEVQQLARQVGQEIFVADNLNEALDIAETVNPDLILFDHWFHPTGIREFLNMTEKNSINVPVVAVGNDESDRDLSAEFIQMGAYDYLQGRSDYSRLEQIVSRIKNKSKDVNTERSAGDFFAQDYAASVSMVGRSKAFVKMLGMIRLVAASRCNPVLIVGETGTGKELAAKAVHTLRRADREKIGLLELAGTGTILLDEISEMPMDLQAKLLRVLQDKTFRMVGGVKNITCNATIIASSNRNLYREAKANRFRRDLYYRLNICPVIIVPLKSPDRKEDIPLLAEYFLKTSTICPEKHNKITSLTKLAVEALQEHDWPGNVRELSNVIERAILLETTDKIGLSSIAIEPPESGELSESPTAGHIKDFSLAKAERELIARALQETGWQKTKAADLLGITRATLYAKVRLYNIEKGSYVAKGLPIDIPASSSPQPITATQ